MGPEPESPEVTMGLTVLISTRPLASSVLEQLIGQWLPREHWNLHAQSAEGRQWRLQLATSSCEEQLDGLLGAALTSPWLTCLDFSPADTTA